MTRETDALIEQLTAAAAPVRRVRHPLVSGLLWFALALSYMTVVALAMRPRADLSTLLRDAAFLWPIAVSVLAAVSAVVAAFAFGVPAYPRGRLAALAVLPVGWFAVSCGTAVLDAAASPSDASGWQCMASLMVFAGVPLLVLGAQLRRRAPMAPVPTLVCAALAAGALADVGTRVCHTATSGAHLLWHALAVVTLVAVAAIVAPRVLQWRAMQVIPR